MRFVGKSAVCCGKEDYWAHWVVHHTYRDTSLVVDVLSQEKVERQTFAQFYFILRAVGHLKLVKRCTWGCLATNYYLSRAIIDELHCRL